MDFLGSRKDSDQQILTLHFLPLEFIYIAVFDKKCTVDDVVNLFNDLEKKLGCEDFNRIFHTVLTDRDILFNKYESFEQSSLDKNKKRMNIFYCNPTSSSQKANVENSNNQLRRIFLKDDLIQDVTSSMISEINSNLNSRYLASLDGMTAYEAFNLAYGEKILKALDVNYVESNNVRILNYKSYASIQT